MLYCRVLVGHSAQASGEGDIMAPPIKQNGTSKTFDSTTDDDINPDMFVIYESDQAYPQYLIRYKKHVYDML